MNTKAAGAEATHVSPLRACDAALCVLPGRAVGTAVLTLKIAEHVLLKVAWVAAVQNNNLTCCDVLHHAGEASWLFEPNIVQTANALC